MKVSSAPFESPIETPSEVRGRSPRRGGRFRSGTKADLADPEIYLISDPERVTRVEPHGGAVDEKRAKGQEKDWNHGAQEASALRLVSGSPLSSSSNLVPPSLKSVLGRVEKLFQLSERNRALRLYRRLAEK